MEKVSRQPTLYWLLMLLWAVGCQQPSEYQKLVNRELAQGERVDSLFMGLALGMTRKEFFAHCWELNRQGKWTDGPGNTSVEYEMKELKHPAYMHFYPDFHEDKIYKMPVKIKYKAWAPWNKHLFSDSLQQDVLALFKRWYGDDFIALDHPEKGSLYIKVDGNRRIMIAQYDEVQVMVLFSDLTVDKSLTDKQLSNHWLF